MNIQEGFLLPRERRIGHVFRCCAGPYRNRGIAVSHQFLVGAADLLGQLRRKGRLKNPGSDFLPAARQGLDVINIDDGHASIDSLLQSVLREKILIGKRRGRKSAGNAYSRAVQLPDHFPQRGILAAHRFNVAQTHFVQSDDISVRLHVSILYACGVWCQPIFYPQPTTRAPRKYSIATSRKEHARTETHRIRGIRRDWHHRGNARPQPVDSVRGNRFSADHNTLCRQSCHGGRMRGQGASRRKPRCGQTHYFFNARRCRSPRRGARGRRIHA